ncbi:IS110 family transposase, partial [Carboxydothermus pertinax]
MKTLFVGIDVSMKDFKAQFMDNLGEIVSKRQKFSNDNPGLEALINLVL